MIYQFSHVCCLVRNIKFIAMVILILSTLSFRFLFKNSGVLLENDMVQIGIKSEYKKNFGRLMVFYGNKTTFQIIGFNATVTCPGDLSDALQCQVLD